MQAHHTELATESTLSMYCDGSDERREYAQTSLTNNPGQHCFEDSDGQHQHTMTNPMDRLNEMNT